MKKILLALAVFSISMSGWAFDMGVNIDNATTILAQQGPTLAQGNTATLWFQFDVPDIGRLDVSGIYDFLFTAPYQNGAVIEPYRFDVGILRWASNINLDQAIFSYQLGRRMVQDITGQIYASKMDGFRLELATGIVTTWLAADYTGFVVKKNSSVSVSGQDTSDMKDNSVVFAPHRIVASAGLNIAELFFRQDLAFELSGEYDLRLNPVDPINLIELAFRINGPLLPGLREQIEGAMQIVNTKDANMFAYLFDMQWVYNLPIPGGTLTLDGTFTSGQPSPTANFQVTSFQAIAGKSLTLATQTMPGNVADIGLNFSFIPLTKLNVGIKANSLFRTSTQAAASGDFKADSTGIFLGEEASLYGTWDIVPECSIGLTTAIFFPNAGPNPDATMKDGTKPNIIAALTVNLKF